MNDFAAIQRTTEWANAHGLSPELGSDLVRVAPTTGPSLVLVPELGSDVRTTLPVAHEVGTWSLEYLGPGFHVQLRIARRQRQARIDGWMSPAQPIKVFLSSLLRQPVVLEAQVSETGRFEFPVTPTGACRMSFVTDDHGRPPATPPFWI